MGSRTIFVARLAEAILLLKMGNRADTPRIMQLLDESAAVAFVKTLTPQCKPYATSCACTQIVGGNAVLGRVMLDDVASRQPDNVAIKAALAAIQE